MFTMIGQSDSNRNIFKLKKMPVFDPGKKSRSENTWMTPFHFGTKMIASPLQPLKNRQQNPKTRKDMIDYSVPEMPPRTDIRLPGVNLTHSG